MSIRIYGNYEYLIYEKKVAQASPKIKTKNKFLFDFHFFLNSLKMLKFLQKNEILILSKILSGLSILNFIFVFIIDSLIMDYALEKANIGEISNTEFLNLEGIKYSSKILLAIYILIFVTLIRQLENKFYLIYLSVISFLILIPHEALVFKFISCFNYATHVLITTRSILIFLTGFLLFLQCLIFISNQSQYHGEFMAHKFMFILSFSLFVIFIDIIMALNAITLVQLKSLLKHDLSSNRVNIGLFNLTDIEKIQNGTYGIEQDMNSINRFVASLKDIQKSELRINEKWTYFDKVINCSQVDRNFFTDCEKSSRIIIRFSYLFDNSQYPNFNCITDDINSCSSGCAFLFKYKLYLYQKIDSYIYPGWKGLCNCGPNDPVLYLKERNPNYLCSSATNINLEPKSLFLIFILFNFYYFNLF